MDSRVQAAAVTLPILRRFRGQQEHVCRPSTGTVKVGRLARVTTEARLETKVMGSCKIAKSENGKRNQSSPLVEGALDLELRLFIMLEVVRRVSQSSGSADKPLRVSFQLTCSWANLSLCSRIVFLSVRIWTSSARALKDSTSVVVRCM